MGADVRHIEHYAEQHQLEKVITLLRDDPDPTVILPRFRRMLLRAEGVLVNLLSGHETLPQTANMKDLENPARLCQYKTMQLLYQRAFPAWLAQQDTNALRAWIDRSVALMTKSARQMNGKGKTGQLSAIVAKAAGLIQLDDGDTVWDFSDKILGATAAEFKVQQGYTSNRERARKQAKYIEDLRCDVIALGFHAFLRQAGQQWLLSMDTENVVRPAALSDIATVQHIGLDDRVATWEAVLYFLMHLVPVEEVTRLSHQLRKWSGLVSKANEEDLEQTSEQVLSERKALLKRIEKLFTLYIDMHDAVMEGGHAISVSKDVAGFCEDAVLKRAFPETGGADQRVPLRGLREVERFGGFGSFKDLLFQMKVTQEDLSALSHIERPQASGESEVERAQNAKRQIRDSWEKNKSNLTEQTCRTYAQAAGTVVRHRYLANRVALTSHLRVYSTMVAVCARLVDFAGMWERDLYFTLLGLLRDDEMKPVHLRSGRKGKEIFTSLRDGRMVRAVRALGETKPDIFEELKRRFHTTFEQTDLIISTRNRIAHFDILHPGRPVDLTGLVNDVRNLMRYDSKLCNAVPKAVIDLLERDGFILTWQCNKDHQLHSAKVGSKKIKHLGKRYLVEALLDEQSIKMMAQAFAGEPDTDKNFLGSVLYARELPELIKADFTKQRR